LARKKPGPKKLPKDQLKPERPVVSVRFDPPIFAQIKAEADARGVTITDEVSRRLLRYEILRQGDDPSGATGALAVQEAGDGASLTVSVENAAWLGVMRRDLEGDLRNLGYTRIDGPGGALWAEPGANIPASIVKTIQEANPVTIPKMMAQDAMQDAARKAEEDKS
jgi:hypothetical protein